MKKEKKIENHPLFSGLSAEEITRIMHCFRFYCRRYRKNEYILMEGDEVRQVGIILDGEILMEKEDMLGEGCFFMKLQQGELFGDMFIGEQVHCTTLNYRALSDCEVMLFQYRTLWPDAGFTGCRYHDGMEKEWRDTEKAVQPGVGRHICDCHLRFVENLTGLLALKTRRMLAKVEILSTGALRQRILTCLRLVGQSPQGKRSGSGGYTVELPFNKTELAEFLCVNRSALMRELSRMREEGILVCDGKVYTVL